MDTAELWSTWHGIPRASRGGAQVGERLYERIFKHYTKKQWDKYPAELDASVLMRLPCRTSTDDRYFNDEYQARCAPFGPNDPTRMIASGQRASTAPCQDARLRAHGGWCNALCVGRRHCL